MFLIIILTSLFFVFKKKKKLCRCIWLLRNNLLQEAHFPRGARGNELQQNLPKIQMFWYNSTDTKKNPKKVRRQVMDICCPVLIKLWPRNMAIISKKYLVVYLTSNWQLFLTSMWWLYPTSMWRLYLTSILHLNLWWTQKSTFCCTIFVVLFWAKTVIWKTNVLVLLFLKIYCCNILVWLMTFVNWSNKALKNNNLKTRLLLLK